jgi:glycyl-tRNA synthetase beta subunit
MNWYDKFLKIARRNIFDIIAIDICRRILTNIKEVIGENVKEYKQKYNEERLDEQINNFLIKRNMVLLHLALFIHFYR